MSEPNIYQTIRPTRFTGTAFSWLVQRLALRRMGVRFGLRLAFALALAMIVVAGVSRPQNISSDAVQSVPAPLPASAAGRYAIFDGSVAAGKIVPVSTIADSPIVAAPQYRIPEPPMVSKIAAFGAVPPFVEPDSYHIIPGNRVQFFGSRFTPGETITITSGNVSLGSIKADSYGRFSSNWIHVPYASGNKSYIFWGTETGIGYRVVLTVATQAKQPWFIMSHYYLGAESEVVLAAHGFGSEEIVRAAYGGVSIGQSVTDSGGSAQIIFTVPSLGAGKYAVTVMSEKTGLIASDYFTAAY